MINSKEMKYVLDRDSLKFVIFSAGMAHSEMGRGWTSAGFVRFTTYDNGDIVVNCYGKSVSLQLEYEQGDEEVLADLMKEIF